MVHLLGKGEEAPLKSWLNLEGVVPKRETAGRLTA